MDLIKCPKCNAEISEWTLSCPACGLQLETLDELEKRRKEKPTIRDVINKQIKRLLFLQFTWVGLAFLGLIVENFNKLLGWILFVGCFFSIGLSIVIGLFFIVCPKCGSNLFGFFNRWGIFSIFLGTAGISCCPFCKVDFDEEIKARKKN